MYTIINHCEAAFSFGLSILHLTHNKIKSIGKCRTAIIIWMVFDIDILIAQE